MRCAYPPYGAGDRHRRVPRQFRHQNQRWPGGGCAALIRPTALVTAIDDALSFRSFSSKSYGGICGLHIVPTDLLT